MPLHGLIIKAATTVVTGAVGSPPTTGARRIVAKAPLQEAAVTATEWGLRGARKAEETRSPPDSRSPTWWPRHANASAKRAAARGCGRRPRARLTRSGNRRSQRSGGSRRRRLTVLSDAAGRMRMHAPWLRSSARRAVAVEDAVERPTGVRAVHAYPRTASVVVWYSPKRCDRDAMLAAIAPRARRRPSWCRNGRRHSADIAQRRRAAHGRSAGWRWRCSGVRRYVFARPRAAGPDGRLSPPARRSSRATRSCAARCARCAAAGRPAPTRWSRRRPSPASSCARTSSP